MSARLPIAIAIFGLIIAIGSLLTRPDRAKPQVPPTASVATSLAGPKRTKPPPSGSVVVAPSGSAVAPPPPPSSVVGRDACTATRGPIQLAFTGPVALVGGGPGGEPLVVFNRDGAPHVVTLPAISKKSGADAGAKDATKGERLALGEPAEAAVSPACAAAGASVYCLDKGGAIHRSTVSGDGSSVVAKARPGSPLAAAVIGGSHTVYAFLADRKTTEGAMTLAFAGFDDATPVLLSEDGSGATFVSLASRGDQTLAMYVDARRVLTPVHARVLSFADTLSLGRDAVVFVGSGTDGRTAPTLARSAGGHEHVLLPMDKDDRTFGMAAIRIEDEPHDDAATVWSAYPGAIDRPVIAATVGTSPVRVLRTRPVDAQAGAKTALELGELDGSGAFKELCTVAVGSSFADPALFVDATGALWIAYTDADGTWIERRG